MYTELTPYRRYQPVTRRTPMFRLVAMLIAVLFVTVSPGFSPALAQTKTDAPAKKDATAKTETKGEAKKKEPLLKPLGVYFEQSGSEAAAAALLGASINYPMRGAVTWKSVVGTNVASDALSHVAAAGVDGGSLIVIGEDYGEGASILQERTHSTALKSSVPLIDPRNSLPSFARFVEEGFGLSEACHQPVFFSIRIRACHMRGELTCKDNVRPAISMRSPIE